MRGPGWRWLAPPITVTRSKSSARPAKVDDAQAAGLGEDDQFQTVDYAERFAAEIPATRLVRILRAGHIPMENEPSAVAHALGDFFAGR